jgi:hypothetical protein
MMVLHDAKREREWYASLQVTLQVTLGKYASLQDAYIWSCIVLVKRPRSPHAPTLPWSPSTRP